MANHSKKNKKFQTRLFSTLASIERTDQSATKRRKRSHLNSLQQSAAAAGQTRLHGVLLEVRILAQRCLTEGISHTAAGDAENDGEGGDEEGGAARVTVKAELDALLENLLTARHDLLGHQLAGADDSTTSDEKEDVNYAKLIGQAENVHDEAASNYGESPSDNDSCSNNRDDSTPNLAEQLENEYISLQRQWKAVLNKHNSNLALHSGLCTNSSNFQSKAVDVSFWEQVQGVMEHECFKQQTSSAAPHNNEIEGGVHLQFNDSKLYQQMLKDVISLSQANGGITSRTNTRGMANDPSKEAAERLKRALRKKTGSAGDVDLTTLLTEEARATAASRGMSSSNNAAKKRVTVDRKASKGRKIRYSVYPKLVNFTFPVAREEPKINEDVWFKSLFGGVGNAR